MVQAMKSDPPDEVKNLLESANRGAASLTPLKGLSFVRKLGQGGMGAVYLLEDESTGKQQALKIIIPGIAGDSEAEQLFVREVENTRALNHENIVRFLGAGAHEGIMFFTMEFCSGGSAADLIPEGATLPVADAVDITLQTLNGLEYAHQAVVPVLLADGHKDVMTGLVHRDLKPWNILISVIDGLRIAKVADFGLSKAFEAAGLTRVSHTGEVGGTPAFMPRHQFINFRRARPEVDVWAAAASLYFLLTGTAPRLCPPGRTWADVIRKDRAVPIRNHNATVPLPLADVIDKALDDSGPLKFSAAKSFANALEQATKT
jgi:serine/threonine protein kinase